MKDFINKLGSNFVVSAFVPSLAFVAMAIVVFKPIVPPDLLNSVQNTFEPFGQSGILLLALTVILGFTLSNLNTSIYKILEGYSLLARFPLGRNRQLRKFNKLKQQLETVENEITQMEQSAKPDEDHLSRLEDLRYYIASEMNLRFPLKEEAILPTAFGNMLRAAEAYSADRYGIDAVRLWPRLIHVIPDSYYEKVEQSNNGLAFLINCSILSLLFGFLCMLASGYQYLVWQLALQDKTEVLYFVRINYPSRVYCERIYIYGVIFVVMLVFSFVFYKGSFPIVMQYGNMIRSSFDLFRFQLLKQLNLDLPKDLDQERDLWSKISEFIAIGEHRGTLSFEYQIATDKAEKASSCWPFRR